MKITLKAARINAKMTQKDVADALKVSVKTIFTWEHDDNPSTVAVYALCQLYGISTDDIFLSK